MRESVLPPVRVEFSVVRSRFRATLIGLLGIIWLTGCATPLRQGLGSITSGSGSDAGQSASITAAEESAAEDTATRSRESNLDLSEFDVETANELLPLMFAIGDQIRVSIWGYPELDYTAEVQPTGTITLPLIGEIRAAGLTVAELRNSIRDALQPFDEVTPQTLRRGDTLALRVWQHPDLSEQAIIEPDGMVTFPLVGRIQAADRPVQEVTDEATESIDQFIRDAEVAVIPTFMGRRFLQDYEVSVLAEQLTPRRVAVIGEVNIQGLLTIDGSLRLVEALALSQVSQTNAALDSIVVIRDMESDAPRYQSFRINQYLAGEASDQNIYLRGGDIVIVPQSFIARVGTFVDRFFSRTLPLFSFWSAINLLSVADDSADTVLLINESLRRGLLDIVPTL